MLECQKILNINNESKNTDKESNKNLLLLTEKRGFKNGENSDQNKENVVKPHETFCERQENDRLIENVINFDENSRKNIQAKKNFTKMNENISFVGEKLLSLVKSNAISSKSIKQTKENSDFSCDSVKFNENAQSLSGISNEIVESHENLLVGEKLAESVFKDHLAEFDNHLNKSSKNLVDSTNKFKNNEVSKVTRSKKFLCESEHSNVEEKEKPARTCKFCNKEFNNLKKHIENSLNSEKYQCYICSKEFVSSCVLKLHLENHSDKEIAEVEKSARTCKFCNQEFSAVRSLKRHITRLVKKCQCYICSKELVSRCVLKLHLENHSEKEIAEVRTCKFCNQEFSAVSLPKTHITGSVKCYFCSKEFVSRCVLRLHLKNHSEREIVEVEKSAKTCKFCNQEFSTVGILKRHITRSVKKCQCYICSKEFVSRCVLRLHLDNHSEKEIAEAKKSARTCKFCNQEFNRVSHLKNHIKYFVNSEKKYQCYICSEELPARCALELHTNIHAMESFDRISEKRNSEEVFHEECVYCNRKFEIEYQFKLHMKLKHGFDLFLRHNYREHSMKEGDEDASKKSVCLDKLTSDYSNENLKIDNVFLKLSEIGKKKHEDYNECKDCDIKFEAMRMYAFHMKWKHKIVRPFKCHVCVRNFSTFSNLSKHILTHSGKRDESDHRDKSFSSQKKLKMHLLGDHSVSKLICPYCDKKFSYKETLNKHLKKYKSEESYTCDICSLELVSKCLLNKHKRLQHIFLIDKKRALNYPIPTWGEKYVKNKTCPFCKRVFANTLNLKTHLSLFWNGKIASCEYCDKNFVSVCLLKAHEASAHRKLHCNFCGKTFTSAYISKKHAEKNTEFDTYDCGSCTESFPSRCLLLLHKSNERCTLLQKKKNIFECPYCKLKFARPFSLREHLRNLGNIGACKLCGMKFSAACLRKLHYKTEHSEHFCNYCDKKFTNQTGLRLHLRITGCKKCLKKFEATCLKKLHQCSTVQVHSRRCEFCGQTFNASTSNYSRHIKSNLGEYKCTVCPQVFPSKCAFLIHEASHQKTCNFCQGAFTKRSSLLRHLRRNENSHNECSICYDDFPAKCLLDKHLLNVHRKRKLSETFQTVISKGKSKKHRRKTKINSFRNSVSENLNKTPCVIKKLQFCRTNQIPSSLENFTEKEVDRNENSSLHEKKYNISPNSFDPNLVMKFKHKKVKKTPLGFSVKNPDFSLIHEEKEKTTHEINTNLETVSQNDNRNHTLTNDEEFNVINSNFKEDTTNEKKDYFTDDTEGLETSNDYFADDTEGLETSNDYFADDTEGLETSNDYFTDNNEGLDISNNYFADDNEGLDIFNDYFSSSGITEITSSENSQKLNYEVNWDGSRQDKISRVLFDSTSKNNSQNCIL